VDRQRTGPPPLAPGAVALTSMRSRPARSLPDYFTSDVARPGMSAAVGLRTASMTSFAGRNGTAHHTPCLIQVLPRPAVPPFGATTSSQVLMS
jgi:hypothetical protein